MPIVKIAINSYNCTLDHYYDTDKGKNFDLTLTGTVSAPEGYAFKEWSPSPWSPDKYVGPSDCGSWARTRPDCLSCFACTRMTGQPEKTTFTVAGLLSAGHTPPFTWHAANNQGRMLTVVDNYNYVVVNNPGLEISCS